MFSAIKKQGAILLALSTSIFSQAYIIQIDVWHKRDAQRRGSQKICCLSAVGVPRSISSQERIARKEREEKQWAALFDQCTKQGNNGIRLITENTICIPRALRPKIKAHPCLYKLSSTPTVMRYYTALGVQVDKDTVARTLLDAHGKLNSRFVRTTPPVVGWITGGYFYPRFIDENIPLKRQIVQHSLHRWGVELFDITAISALDYLEHLQQTQDSGIICIVTTPWSVHNIGTGLPALGYTKVHTHSTCPLSHQEWDEYIALTTKDLAFWLDFNLDLLFNEGENVQNQCTPDSTDLDLDQLRKLNDLRNKIAQSEALNDAAFVTIN